MLLSKLHLKHGKILIDDDASTFLCVKHSSGTLLATDTIADHVTRHMHQQLTAKASSK